MEEYSDRSIDRKLKQVDNTLEELRRRGIDPIKALRRAIRSHDQREAKQAK